MSTIRSSYLCSFKKYILYLAESVYPSNSNAAISLRETNKSHPSCAFVIPPTMFITFPLILYVMRILEILSLAPATTPLTSTNPKLPPVGVPNASHKPILSARFFPISVHPPLPVSRHVVHGYQPRDASRISQRSSWMERRKSLALGTELGSYRGGSNKGLEERP